jgi:hypothetical protein
MAEERTAYKMSEYNSTYSSYRGTKITTRYSFQTSFVIVLPTLQNLHSWKSAINETKFFNCVHHNLSLQFYTKSKCFLFITCNEACNDSYHHFLIVVKFHIELFNR